MAEKTQKGRVSCETTYFTVAVRRIIKETANYFPSTVVD